MRTVSPPSRPSVHPQSVHILGSRGRMCREGHDESYRTLSANAAQNTLKGWNDWRCGTTPKWMQSFGVAPLTAIMVGEWYLRSRSAHRDAQGDGGVQATPRGNGPPVCPPHPRRVPPGGTSGIHPLCPTLWERRRSSSSRCAPMGLSRSPQPLPLGSGFILSSTVSSAVHSIGSVPSMTSSVMPGVDTDSISMTSAQPGAFRTTCTVVSHGSLLRRSSME